MVHAEEPLRKLLNKIAEEQNYTNPEIIINEISSGGANYTSKLYTATVRGDNKEDLQLFAKIGAVGEKVYDGAFASFYNTEQFAYMKLWKIFAALEEEHGVPEEHRVLYTKCYGFDPTKYQEILVLENLLTQGYGSFDRLKSIDWEYASAAVAECAKLHALCFALQKYNPEEYKKALDVCNLSWENMNMEAMMGKSVQNALKVVNPKHKKAFEKFIKLDPTEAIQKFYSPVRATVIAHGDFRGSNLLHRVRENGKIDIKIVDLQTLQGGSPVADLLYFIFTGSDEQFRARYFDRLVDYYYSELSAAMRRLHLNPDEVYSREVFDQEFKEKLPYGLCVATYLLPIVTVDPDEAPVVHENLELTDFGIDSTANDLYIERINGIIEDYVKWGVLI